jgi:hypothetical protein
LIDYYGVRLLSELLPLADILFILQMMSLGANPGLRGERSATNGLSHDTAVVSITHLFQFIDVEALFFFNLSNILLSYSDI